MKSELDICNSNGGTSLDTLPQQIKCFEKAAKKANDVKAVLVPKRESFDNATKAYDNKRVSCGNSQGAFERKFWEYTCEYTESCTTHASKFADKKASNDKVEAEVKIVEQARKHQHIAATHVICFADVILQSNVTLQGQKLSQ